MATTTIETTVANRGRKAGGMTAKQIKFFGTKRQKAALKAARKRKSSAAAHRPRTKPNASKKRQPAASHSKPARRKVARKQNLGGIFALTANPAKGHKSMAKTKQRKSSKAHSTAGYKPKHHQKNPGHRRRASNPGAFGSPKDWLTGGAGVLAGVVGTRALPQLVLGASNTGPIGYVANAATTGILTFLAHLAMPRNRVFSASVLAGGVAAIISRVIGDYSLLGSYSSQVGLGDYLFNFNFGTPQILGGDRRSIGAPGAPSPTTVPVNVGGAGAGVAGMYGAPLY